MKTFCGFLGLLMALLWGACGSNTFQSKENQEDTTSVRHDSVEKGSAFIFDTTSIQRKVKPDKSVTPYKGALIQAVTWMDKSGKNTLIFSRKEEYIINKEEELRRAEFYACCYIDAENEVRKIWEITDFVDSCHCDCEVRLKEETITILDIDEDGIAENLFIYVLNDRCDASPVSTKLMMHSGSAKMAIRGISEQFLGPSEAETNRFRKELGLKAIKFKEVDAIFEQFPEIFRSYASKYWDDYITRENTEFKKLMQY